jgi:hypothetical protein
MRKSVLPLFALIFATAHCEAAFLDGNKLHEGCKVSRSLVIGFVAGSVETSDIADIAIGGLFATGQMSDSDFKKIYLSSRALIKAYCPPQGATLNQYVDIYCQFIMNNPSERHLQASLLLNKSLMAVGPCKK